MKIDIDAFLQSLPIMAVGLLGIFIVTIVIILGIYLLKAVASKSAEDAESEDDGNVSADEASDEKKESAMDLMKEREKTDFLKEEEHNYISHDL